jgi:hypothetical protein
MRFPKDFQQFLVGDDRRIKCELNDFGMAGVAGANLLVTGIGRLSTGETGNDRLDAGDALENGLGAPEAAAPEGGDLDFGQGIRRGRLSIHNGHKIKTKKQQAGHSEQRGGRAIRNVETNGFHYFRW